MKTETREIYICEYCGRFFTIKNDAILHESKCYYNKRHSVKLDHNLIKKHTHFINKSCDYFGVDSSYIYFKTRKREFVLTRHILIYIYRKYNDLSNTYLFVDNLGLDRTSLYHCVKTISNLIDVDKYIRKKVIDIDLIYKQTFNI